jgi:hypothetical protein
MDVSQLHIEKALTNVSISYQNAEFVAERVFPELPVDNQSDKYYVFGKERFRALDDKRRPGGTFSEIKWGLSNDSYYCEGHGLRDLIPIEARSNADPAVDLDITSTETLTDQILLAREVSLVAALAAGLTPVDLTAAGTPFDSDAADPVKIIDQRKETIATAIGRRPNCLLLSRPVLRGVRNNANIVGRVTGAAQLADTLVTVEQLKTLFEVDDLIVADAVKLTSADGQADTMDFIWGKYALLFYRPPSIGRRVVALGAHFRWSIGQQGALVEKWWDQNRKADVIDAYRYYDQKIIAPTAGTLFSNCVS